MGIQFNSINPIAQIKTQNKNFKFDGILWMDQVTGYNMVFPPLPPTGTPERLVLQCLVDAQRTINGHNKDKEFDPFRLATVNIANIYALLDRSKLGCNAAEVVDGMLESKLLARAPRVVVEHNPQLSISAAPHDATNLTFGSPAHFLFLTHVEPHVFISYAATDRLKANELKEQLQRFQLRVSTYEDPVVAAAIQRLGFESWMQQQASGCGQGAYHFSIVLLTKAYLERLLDPTSGCAKEAEAVMKQFAGLQQVHQHQHRQRLLLLAPEGAGELILDSRLLKSEAAKWLCSLDRDNRPDRLIFDNKQFGSLIATIFSLTTAAATLPAQASLASPTSSD